MERLERAETPGRSGSAADATWPKQRLPTGELPAAGPIQPPTGANEAALIQVRHTISSCVLGWLKLSFGLGMAAAWSG